MYLGNRKTQYAIDNDLDLRQQSISVLLQQAGVHYHVINPRIEEIERYILIPEVVEIAQGIQPQVWQELAHIVHEFFDISLTSSVDSVYVSVTVARLNGTVLLTKKKEPEGIKERIRIIEEYLPGIIIPDLYEKAKEFKCNADDLADAIGLSIAARLKTQGMCETIPEQPEIDENGLYMRLTVPKKTIKG
jgi:predicted RNase H-like nuclease